MKYTVGKVYEIDPYLKITVNYRTFGEKFYAKLVGFNSDNEPIWERGKNYVCWDEKHAKITEIMPERGE